MQLNLLKTKEQRALLIPSILAHSGMIALIFTPPSELALLLGAFLLALGFFTWAIGMDTGVCSDPKNRNTPSTLLLGLTIGVLFLGLFSGEIGSIISLCLLFLVLAFNVAPRVYSAFKGWVERGE